MTDFKIYDDVAQLVATGGGGSSLPITGGSLTGDLTMIVPAKVVQCENPSNPCDVVNLQYFQSNNPVSSFSGVDPNITTPTDRPATNGIIYIGSNNGLWVFNGTSYSAINGTKLSSFFMLDSDQSMNIGDYVEFGPNITNTLSTQGLTVSDSNNGSIFTFNLQPGRPPAKVKITVSISALFSSASAKFFTFNLTINSFSGPGSILDNNGLFTSTPTYSEIIEINPGSLSIGVRLRNATISPINIGDGITSLTYRWILIEEI